MQRRTFIIGLTGVVLTPLMISHSDVWSKDKALSIVSIQTNWRKFLSPGVDISSSTNPIEKTKAEWRALLPVNAYHVLFEDGTERSFSSHLDGEKRDGLYVCAACNLPLFSSEMKYDSGTGWPSFFTTIPNHLATKLDFKLIIPRTEYHCVRCGGHQGHVFEDGPKPTGERWCNNGVALTFIPA